MRSPPACSCGSAAGAVTSHGRAAADRRPVRISADRRHRDHHAFDLRSVKKSCVHIAHPDGRIIPFDTYNLFYRDDLETKVLQPLRAERRS
jgi:hypothetical protein